MAANQIIEGKVWQIRTTGFVTSTSIKIDAVMLVGSAAVTSITVVERATKLPIIRGRMITNGGTFMGPFTKLEARGGLSCTALGGSSEVMVYSK